MKNPFSILFFMAAFFAAQTTFVHAQILGGVGNLPLGKGPALTPAHDPWAEAPASLLELTNLAQVSLEAPLAPNQPQSGLWWVFSVKRMTKRFLLAPNPANDTLLIQIEPEFTRNLTGDTSAMNIVRELRLKFWVPGGEGSTVQGNWAVVYQSSYGDEVAIAKQMALGHLWLFVPSAQKLQADYPTIWGHQWKGASAVSPREGRDNLQIMLWR